MSNAKQIVGLAAAMLIGVSAAAHAGLQEVSIFNNIVYDQNSGAGPTGPGFYFFNIGGVFQQVGDFDSVTATYPGAASPVDLTPTINGLSFGIASSFSTPAALASAYPFGTYAITATNSVTSSTQSSSISYVADHFTTAVPTVGAELFSGFDPSQDFHLTVNAFIPEAGSTEGFGFFNVFDDATGTLVFGANFLSPTTLGIDIPANTLSATKTYRVEFDFSDRVNEISAGVPTFQGFDVRTVGKFTTGAVAVSVPEPGSWGLMLAGLGFVGSALRLRRKA